MHIYHVFPHLADKTLHDRCIFSTQPCTISCCPHVLRYWLHVVLCINRKCPLIPRTGLRIGQGVTWSVWSHEQAAPDGWPEVSGQRLEVSGQRLEVSGQRSAAKGQRPEIGGQHGQRPPVSGRWPRSTPQLPIEAHLSRRNRSSRYTWHAWHTDTPDTVRARAIQPPPPPPGWRSVTDTAVRWASAWPRRASARTCHARSHS